MDEKTEILYQDMMSAQYAMQGVLWLIKEKTPCIRNEFNDIEANMIAQAESAVLLLADIARENGRALERAISDGMTERDCPQYHANFSAGKRVRNMYHSTKHINPNRYTLYPAHSDYFLFATF